MLRKLGFSVKIPTASFTSGLVGDSSPFSVLPQVLFCDKLKLRADNWDSSELYLTHLHKPLNLSWTDL